MEQDESRKLGNFGEKIACKHLENKGYKILGRNYSKILDCKLRGEIDIIAEKDKIVRFIEVKSQKTPGRAGSFLPEDRVDSRKKKQLLKLAQFWLAENNFPCDSGWQIDVISVKIDFENKKAKIRHFENAVF